MPVWNRAAHVGGAIESVLAQTHSEFELVIVDDGSSDGLEQAVGGYLADRRVRLLRRPHRGVSAARNFGLAASSAPLIAYLDSDNRWRPRFLERMGEAVAGSGARFAYCDAARFRRARVSGRLRPLRRRLPELDLPSLLDDNCIDINTVVHHRSLAADAGGWDESLPRMNDWDFVIRLAARVQPVHVAETLVEYYMRVVPGTITATEPAMPAGLRIDEKYRGLRVPRITVDGIEQRWKRPGRSRHASWVRFVHQSVDPDSGRAEFLPCVLRIEPVGPQPMEPDLFRRIVDGGRDWLLMMALDGWEDPALHPALSDMVAYAEARDVRTVVAAGLDRLLHAGRHEGLLRSRVSVLVVRAEASGAGLADLAGRIEALVAARRRLRASAFLDVRVEVPPDEVETAAAWAEHIGTRERCSVTIVEDDPAATDRVPGPEGLVPRGIAASTPTVLWDGAVVPGPPGTDAARSVGNVRDDPFDVIWRSPAYAEVRLASRPEVPARRASETGIRITVDPYRPTAAERAIRPLLRNDVSYRLWRRFRRLRRLRIR